MGTSAGRDEVAPDGAVPERRREGIAVRHDRSRDDLEVATVAADTLRATVVVSGPLGGASVLLLSSILRTHLTAGRRYLRVDLALARAGDPDIVDALVEAHRAVAGLGGMLTFEHATGTLDDALRARGLFVRPNDG